MNKLITICSIRKDSDDTVESDLNPRHHGLAAELHPRHYGINAKLPTEDYGFWRCLMVKKKIHRIVLVRVFIGLDMFGSF